MMSKSMVTVKQPHRPSADLSTLQRVLREASDKHDTGRCKDDDNDDDDEDDEDDDDEDEDEDDDDDDDEDDDDEDEDEDDDDTSLVQYVVAIRAVNASVDFCNNLVRSVLFTSCTPTEYELVSRSYDGSVVSGDGGKVIDDFIDSNPLGEINDA